MFPQSLLPRLSPRPFSRHLAVLTIAIGLAGCSAFQPAAQLHGNKVDADQLKELTPGTSTRADVTAVIGSPTQRAPFDDNTWIYVSEITRPRIGRTMGVEEQQVVVLTFDDRGILRGIQSKSADDSLPVSVVERKTPSPGSEASFLQQLFGNIGRFNAGGAGVPSGPSGGAPKPF